MKYYFKHKDRPEKFRQDYKFPDSIKDDKPHNSNVKCHHALLSAITLSFND